MTIKLNHTIVNVRDKGESANFFTELFGLPKAKPFGSYFLTVQLDNGVTLLLFENHRLPIVVAAASVRHTRLLEPAAKAGVAELTGRLLDEGTDQQRGQQIAEMINVREISVSTTSQFRDQFLDTYKRHCESSFSNIAVQVL